MVSLLQNVEVTGPGLEGEGWSGVCFASERMEVESSEISFWFSLEDKGGDGYKPALVRSGFNDEERFEQEGSSLSVGMGE